MPPSIASKFPVISHPLSRLGSRESLSVCGSGRFSRDGTHSAEPQITANFTGDHDRLIRATTTHESNRATTEEVLYQLQEKLQTSNLPSVRKLFRANDPKGEGRVPKEAFSRVLWQLYGYLTTRQIKGVLKRLDLDKKECISFDDFFSKIRSHFSNGPTHKATSNWMKAVNSLPANHARAHSEPASLPPATPRSARSARGHLHGLSDSASACWNSLLEKVQTENFDPEHVFSPVCFGEGAYVVPAQFKECLRRLKISATDDDVTKIYRRMEGASPFAIHTKRLFELLGLNPETGRFDIKPSTPHPKSARSRPNLNENDAMMPDQPRPKTSYAAPEVETMQLDRPPSVVRPRTSIDKSKIFDGDVLEFVCKKLEEGQKTLERALEARDTSGRGDISKADLRFAFAELGVPVKVTNLEHFLVRNGLRKKDGRVNYKLLLRRLQSRSKRGLLHKVMRNAEHFFHNDTPGTQPSPQDGVTASMLEALLLDAFQGEFLGLLACFKRRDAEEAGILSLSDFRASLQEQFKITFTDDSWTLFVGSPYIKLAPTPAGYTGNEGFIAYNDFLAKFDVMLRPATVDAEDPWIKNEEDYSHVLEHKKRYLKGMEANPSDYTLRHDPRPLGELEKVLVDVCLHKFGNMKKEYDLIVREDLCRVDKEKFDYIMFRCGFILTASELARLWLSLPITRPIESMSWPGLLRHVMKLHYSAEKPAQFSRQTRDTTFVSHILEKMRQEVTAHWSIMKKKFRYLDPMGTSRIEKDEMLQIIRGLRPNIIEMELYYLVEMLESRIPGKTNYFRMMEYFTKPQSRAKRRQESVIMSTPEPLLSDTTSVIALRPGPPPKPTRQHGYVYKRKPRPPFCSLRNAPATPPFKRVTKHKLEIRGPKTYPHRYDQENALRAGFAGKENEDQYLSLSDVERLYRENAANLVRHPPSVPSSIPSSAPPTFAHVPANQISALRRALRKADLANRGKLPVNAFRRVMQEYGISFRDPNDLYHFLRHYDTKLSDQVSYERFVQNMAECA